ncbi:MAG: hypothetical protein ACK4RV_06515 [Caulobacter sp.]|jgi:uncharacterized BrkB/YihY/UPF0761 family membrane protein
MVRKDAHASLWLVILQHLSMVLLFAPLIGSILVWAVVAIASLTPARAEVLAAGDRALTLLIAVAAVGLVVEFFILPAVLSDRWRDPAE